MQDKLMKIFCFYVNENKRRSLYFKYFVYIICVVCLCLIDQIIGSATGAIQYGLKHYTGVVIAVIMLTAYKIRDFMKIPYFVWTILFFVIRYFVLQWAMKNTSSIMSLGTFFWNVGIYGIILIRLFYAFIIEKKRINMNWFLFAFWLLMVIGMLIIRKDLSWIVPMLLTYVCFYMTNYDDKDLNNFYSGVIDGLIFGFILIQGQALLYRPYDRIQYHGMYSHQNMNALMYVCAYFSVLSKWYSIKLKRKINLKLVICILLSGIILGFCFYTGSRTAFLTIIILSLIFLIFRYISIRRYKIIKVLGDLLLLGISFILCIFPAYLLIRYVPAYVDEPIYFEGDIIEERIQKGDPIDSDKYVPIDKVMNRVFVRYLWFQDEDAASDRNEKIKEFIKKLNLILEVQAANFSEEDEIEAKELFVEPGSDREHPLVRTTDESARWYDVRIDIYKFFLKKLSLIGDEGNEQGVWISREGKATHCHNIYLQFAYDFGIIVGVMFIIVTLFPFVMVIKRLLEKKSNDEYFRLFVTFGFSIILIVFGMLEINWIYGQLPFTMFWLVQYIVYHKQPHEIEAEQASGDGEELLLTTPFGVVIEDGLEIIDMDEE